MTDSKSISSKAEVATSVAVTDDMEVTGTVRIAPTVLIQLIENTVNKIPGVVGFSNLKHKKRDDQITGKAFDDGKIRVVVDGDRLDADIAINLGAGASATVVNQKIRHELSAAAEHMLGMTMRSINVYVDGIATGKN